MTKPPHDDAHDEMGSDDRNTSVTTVDVEQDEEEGAASERVGELPPPDWFLAWMWVNRQRALGRLPN